MAETDFARRIVIWREDNGLTQKKAAELIGIHYRTLQTYESGEHLPDAMVLGKLREVGAPTQFDGVGGISAELGRELVGALTYVAAENFVPENAQTSLAVPSPATNERLGRE